MKKKEVLADRQAMSDTFPESGLVRVDQVAAYIGVHKSSVWRLVKSGKFPKPLKVSSRVSAWRAEHVHEYLEGLSDVTG